MIDKCICTEVLFFVEKHGTPTLRELEELGAEISVKWMAFGRRLGVRDEELHEIDRLYDQLSEKGYRLLKYWNQKEGRAATYHALCTALIDELVQRQDLAEKFCYIKGNYSLHI